MTGRIVTVHAYAGGCGVSTLAASLARCLAARSADDRRVVAVDCHLEAPSLHHQFAPELDARRAAAAPGVLDHLWDYVELLLRPPGARPDDPDDPFALADPARFVRAVGGGLDLLTAGRQDAEYSPKRAGFDWTAFYERFGGAQFVDAMAAALRARYAVSVVDAGSGIGDPRGVLCAQMPDALVEVVNLSRRSLAGARAVAQSVRAQRPEVAIVPVAVLTHGVEPAPEILTEAEETLGAPVLVIPFDHGLASAFDAGCLTDGGPAWAALQGLAERVAAPAPPIAPEPVGGRAAPHC